MPKYDLSFSSPLMNAAGTLGFAPDPRGPVDLARLGAFVTNPISLGARTPAHGVRQRSFPGGFLLHTGHPNPGLRAVMRRYAPRWARAPLPVIVHLLAQGVDEVAVMVERLEGMEGVLGLELGLPPDIDEGAACAMVAAGIGELPVIARLPFERVVQLGPGVVEAGAVAVVMGAPRGALPAADGEFFYGRMYGPAIFPGALATVRALAQREVPVIGAGGVYQQEQAKAILEAGAMAVQLDAVLWRGGW